MGVHELYRTILGCQSRDPESRAGPPGIPVREFPGIAHPQITCPFFFEMSILQLHLLIARVIAKTIRISLLIIYKEICIL